MNMRMVASLFCVVLAAVVVGIARGGPDAEEEVRGFDNDMMEMVVTYGPRLTVAQWESPRLRRDIAELELKWGQQYVISYIDGIADNCSDDEFAFISMLAVSNDRDIGRAVIDMAERCTDSHFEDFLGVLLQNRLEITPAIYRRALQSDDSDIVWAMLMFLDYVQYELEDIPLLQVAIADAAEASDVVWHGALSSLILHRNPLVRWAGQEQAYAFIVEAINSNRPIQLDQGNDKAYYSLVYLESLYGIYHSHERDVTRSRVEVIQSLTNHRAEVLQAEVD